MEKLSSLMNIGKEIEFKLNSIGINNVDDFHQLGVLDTFVRLKQKFPNVCLVHLHVLQGAYDNVEYNFLDGDIKEKLKEFYDEMYR